MIATQYKEFLSAEIKSINLVELYNLAYKNYNEINPNHLANVCILVHNFLEFNQKLTPEQATVLSYHVAALKNETKFKIVLTRLEILHLIALLDRYLSENKNDVVTNFYL